MSGLTLYGIPNCDTVKKARTALDAAGAEYTFHDYKKAGVSRAMLDRWADAAGWETLLNRKGTKFRALTEADKQAIDRGKALALMEASPSLIKRPVIEDLAGRLTVGWSPDAQAAWL